MPERRKSAAETYSKHLPLFPVEAEGVRIRNRDGRWLIDCLAGAGSASLGWKNAVVESAIRDVLESGVPLQTLDFPSALSESFKCELLETMPRELRNGVVHFCSPSGAAAIEAAMALAEIATGGSEHVAVQGGFHGSTRATRSLTGHGARAHNYVIDGGMCALPFPDPYRCPFGIGGTEGLRLAIESAELLLSETGPVQDPASLVVECVQGEAGSVPAPERWLRCLRNLAEVRGIPMIADEVQAGMCRTGKMWSFERAGVVPDVVVASKGLGGGVPVAAIVFRDELNVWGSGAVTGTFRGNALGFAAAVAVLRFAKAHDLFDRVDQAGRLFSSVLADVGASHSLVGKVQGIGLMIGVDIVDPDSDPDSCGARSPSPEFARMVQLGCFSHGVLVEVGGRDGNVVRFLPPLVIDDSDIRDVVRAFEAALLDVSQVRGSR